MTDEHIRDGDPRSIWMHLVVRQLVQLVHMLIPDVSDLHITRTESFRGLHQIYQYANYLAIDSQQLKLLRDTTSTASQRQSVR